MTKQNERKIDLVYAWVDGNDRNWQAKKNSYLQINEQKLDFTSSSDNRFRNNDELKYSIRSVEKYASWINHIYIITDNQVPEWLNTNNPKITMVSHDKIMPPDALPTFNSVAINYNIDNIPNLSEYFLYADDDMFFMDYVGPEFFYKNNGKPICRFKKLIRGNNQLYKKLIENSQNTIAEKFKKRYTLVPHHSIDAYRKSIFSECKRVFENETKINTYSRFRNEENYERILFLYYAIATNKGCKKIISRIDSYLPLYKKIVNHFKKIYRKDSLVVQNINPDFESGLIKYKPYIACINDKDGATDEGREKVHQFFERLFPEKSSFER